jgi:CRP/FNR family transcriptional regulator
MEIVEVLSRVPFLNGLGRAELEALASRTSSRRLLRDEVLFEEGDPAKGLLVVASGSVKITKVSESGREQILTIEGPGSSVAEVPLFDGGPLPASAVALEPTTVLSIPRAEFFAIMRKHPEIGIALVENIGHRLRQLVFLVEELSLKEVGQRVAGFLLEQARRRGTPGENGRIELELDLTNQEIGSRIGTVRELVSRCLGRLRNARIIAVEDRRIRILDIDALEAEAQAGK